MHSRAIQCKLAPYIAVLSIALYYIYNNIIYVKDFLFSYLVFKITHFNSLRLHEVYLYNVKVQRYRNIALTA